MELLDCYLLHQIKEPAGVYNTAGKFDNTSAFCSYPPDMVSSMAQQQAKAFNNCVA